MPNTQGIEDPRGKGERTVPTRSVLTTDGTSSKRMPTGYKKPTYGNNMLSENRGTAATKAPQPYRQNG